MEQNKIIRFRKLCSAAGFERVSLKKSSPEILSENDVSSDRIISDLHGFIRSEGRPPPCLLRLCFSPSIFSPWINLNFAFINIFIYLSSIRSAFVKQSFIVVEPNFCHPLLISKNYIHRNSVCVSRFKHVTNVTARKNFNPSSTHPNLQRKQCLLLKLKYR